MDPEVYAATAGLAAALRNQDIIARNLANVNTSGFRRRVPVDDPFEAQLSEAQAASPVPGEEVVDFSRGPIARTENPLDLALNCDGFFALAGPSGNVYTRKGSFSLNADGAIVDSVGRSLLSSGGDVLRVPGGTREIRVDPSGEVLADGSSVGKVWVVNVAEPRLLVPAAYTAFSLPESAAAPETAQDAAVEQGALEGSNTNAIEELVSMIANLRSFEASQRVLRSIDESLKQTAAAASATAGA